MAEIATIARPYAEATFRAAVERNALAAVSDSLMLLAAIARDEQMHSILLNPKVSAAQKKEIFEAAGYPTQRTKVDGETLEDWPSMTKTEVAGRLAERIAAAIGSDFGPPPSAHVPGAGSRSR